MPVTAQIGKHVLEVNELVKALSAVSLVVRETAVRLHDGTLTASDGEVRVDLAVPGLAGIDQPIVLPHGRLLAMARSCQGTITLTPGETTCAVASKGVRWSLPILDDHLSEDTEPLSPMPRLPVDQFASRVESVRRSATKEAGRFALSGVLIDVDDETVTFVASDGRRMSWAECDHGQSVDRAEVLISARAAAVLSRIAGLQESESGVQMERSSRRLVATFDTAVVSIVCLGGDYPRWRKIIPTRTESRPAAAERGELIAATRSAAIVQSPTSASVTFNLGEQHGELRCSSPEYGSSKVRLPLVEAGDRSAFAIRPGYLIDWLEHLPPNEEPTVEIEAQDGESPVVFRCGDYRCLIAPIAVEA